MNRLRFFACLTLAVVLAVGIVSPYNVRASSARETVTASAIAVPMRVTQLSFLISAPVKEVAVEAGDRVQAGQALVLLNTPELEFSVTVSEAAFHSAQTYAELQRYKRVKHRRNGKVFFDLVPPEMREIADARAKMAQAGLEIARASLAQAALLAPYDGTVAAVKVAPGEFVQPGQVVLTLAELKTMQVETTDLSERDIEKVKLGDSANVFVEALNTNITGKVIGLSPIADIVGGDVVFKVTISLDEQPQGLLWGMTAEVIIGGE